MGAVGKWSGYSAQWPKKCEGRLEVLNLQPGAAGTGGSPRYMYVRFFENSCCRAMAEKNNGGSCSGGSRGVNGIGVKNGGTSLRLGEIISHNIGIKKRYSL
jgi:hypothetical protein